MRNSLTTEVRILEKFEDQNCYYNKINSDATDEDIYDFITIVSKYQDGSYSEIIKLVKTQLQ